MKANAIFQQLTGWSRHRPINRCSLPNSPLRYLKLRGPRLGSTYRSSNDSISHPLSPIHSSSSRPHSSLFVFPIFRRPDKQIEKDRWKVKRRKWWLTKVFLLDLGSQLARWFLILLQLLFIIWLVALQSTWHHTISIWTENDTFRIILIWTIRILLISNDILNYNNGKRDNVYLVSMM